MTPEQQILEEIKARIAHRSDAELIEYCAKSLREFLDDTGEPGLFAFALVGVEIAAK